jgi:hypothetical protein
MLVSLNMLATFLNFSELYKCGPFCLTLLCWCAVLPFFTFVLKYHLFGAGSNHKYYHNGNNNNLTGIFIFQNYTYIVRLKLNKIFYTQYEAKMQYVSDFDTVYIRRKGLRIHGSTLIPSR